MKERKPLSSAPLKFHALTWVALPVVWNQCPRGSRLTYLR